METKINAQNNIKVQKKKVCFAIITGLVCGFINGIFGGGGGMVVVPMLIFMLGLKPDKAHATAILIILPLTILSTILYASFGVLKVNIALPVSIGVTAGGIVGAFLLSKLSNKWVVVIFSVVMAVAGFKMLFF